jgi:hypothetical protein
MTRLVTKLLPLFGVIGTLAQAAGPAVYGKGFPSATAAANALVKAAEADNTAELIAILGPSSKDILSTADVSADQKMRREFVTKAKQKMILVPRRGRPNEMTLVAGNDNWPLPIPLVNVGGKWYFDMPNGRRTIMMRRIGSNELDAIEVCRGYVEAQGQYVAEHHTPDGIPFYAQKIISSPGGRDGLYSPGKGEGESLIGEIIAHAIATGSASRGGPYHGYYFRVLTSERHPGSATPVNYVSNGYMTGGFGLAAWPAQYGTTGVMTFVVDRSGIVYQKNLGPRTSTIMSSLTTYNADRTWSPVSTRVAASQNK